MPGFLLLLESAETPTTYLCDEEVHVMLGKHVQLLLEDGLHLCVALAAQVGGGLGDTPCHQSTPLVGHLPGQLAGGLVDLLSLRSRKPRTKVELTRPSSNLCVRGALQGRRREEGGGFRPCPSP